MCYGIVYMVRNKKNNKVYIGQATRELNISHIGDVCKEKRKFAGGYKFIYEEDYIDLIKYGF